MFAKTCVFDANKHGSKASLEESLATTRRREFVLKLLFQLCPAENPLPNPPSVLSQGDPFGADTSPAVGGGKRVLDGRISELPPPSGEVPNPRP